MAPRVFTKFVRVVLDPLKRLCLYVLHYLDNWLLTGQSQQHVFRQTNVLIAHMDVVELKGDHEKESLDFSDCSMA